MNDIEIFKIFGSFAINGLDEAEKGLNKIDGIGAKVGKEITEFGKVAAKSMVAVGAAVGTVAVAFGTMATKSAMELEATQAKFDTVFGEFADQANATFDEISKLTPMTKAQFNSMSSGIQDLLVPMGFAREEATNLTGKTMNLVGALTNFNSATHSAEDVTALFQSALLGEASALQSLGIQTSAEEVRQRAVAMGLAETTKEVDKQAYALALTEIAYEQSGDALAAYNEESLDTKTKVELLKAEFTTMASEMALGVLPSIMNLVDMAFPLLKQVLESVMPVFDLLIQKVLPPLISLLESILPVVADIIDIFVSWVVDGFDKVTPTIEDFSGGVLPTIITAITEVGDIINAFIVEVVKLFQEWYTDNEETIKKFVDLILLVLVFTIKNLPATFETVFGVIKTVLGTFLNQTIVIIETVQGVFEGLVKFITGVFSGNWSQAWEGIVQIFTSIFSGITGSVKNTLNGAIGMLNSFISGINKIQIPDFVPGMGGNGISIPKIPMLATGGNIIKRGQAIVGESGAELIDLPQGATVTPLTDSQKNSVVGGDTYNVNIYAEDATDVVEKADKFFRDRRVLQTKPS